MSLPLYGPARSSGCDGLNRSTTPKNKVGTVMLDVDGNEYTYIKAEGVIPAYAPVDIQGGLSEAVASTGPKGFLGVNTSVAFADEEYGFILTKGRGLALVPSGTAVGDPLTAGSGALSSTLTNAVKHVTAQEAPVLLSGTTQAKYVWLHN